MDKRVLQSYSTWAKDNLENQIEVSLKALGINGDGDYKKAKKVGDVTTIDGDSTSYPADLYAKRERIISLIEGNGYRNVIEEFAYTWFNRFVALRFMEVHGFLSHGFRVLSDPQGGIEPEVLKNLNLVRDELKLDMNLCSEYKQQGKIEELFRHVLIKQCNILSGILPMLFSSDMGYLELLLPKSLLKGDTVITKLIEIPEEIFMEDVEIIGWMYQFYISSKKDAVYASKKTITKDTLPAVTQLFTPDWIVRYMAQNSVGRLWLESYPESSLRSEMKYYVEDAEQSEEVQKKIDEIKYKNVNPEEIRIIEPCCGSGHILVYVFDLLFKMYEERGYQKRDIPTLILKNNLVGLDVDKRAAQLASFSLVMKARSVNNRFFNENYYELPHVYELQDSKLLEDMEYRKHIKDLGVLDSSEVKQITDLVDLFENGKTIGSLIKIKPIDFSKLELAIDKIASTSVPNLFNIEFLNLGVHRLKELLNQAKVMSEKYDVMVTNPPYIGISSMESYMKEYANKYYPNSKADMLAMFMETDFVKRNGFCAMINMHSWMFLSSYESLRKKLMNTKEILVMVHLGARAFESIGGEIVQTTTFVMRNSYINSYVGQYSRVVDEQSQNAKEQAFLLGNNRYRACQDDYAVIPGYPFAYWVSKKVLFLFSEGTSISSFVTTKDGLTTSNNDKYIRYFWEVPLYKIGFNAENEQDFWSKNKRFAPLIKGGLFRKWYGNTWFVITFSENDRNILSKVGNHLPSEEVYFAPYMTWNRISTRMGFRYCKSGYIFESASLIATGDYNNIMFAIAFSNSSLAKYEMELINPTTNMLTGYVNQLRIPKMSKDLKRQIVELSENCINISKEDWDTQETSWDFCYHPLMLCAKEKEEAMTSQFVKTRIEKLGMISFHYNNWENECKYRYNSLKETEEKINQIFIDIYELHNELSKEVDDKDITVRLADKARDIKSFISYLVGIAMGRYSIDSPGIIFAGGEWDKSKYISYQPDDDGIIPIYTSIGMEDGLTTVLINLIKLIYGEEYYRDNIDFIAEALGKNSNESSEETLNRYLNDGFYSDHLKIYQKRPIYWMFSSGKKAGFKCLVYMHRYNEDTLARINAKYFLPESTRKKGELDELNSKITHVEGRDKLKLEKQRQNLFAAYNEAIEYGQVLDHMANKYISIDLDDGVKVNYAKFQGVEIVTDGGSKVKKDLLAPLK